uniref:Uncharacterized protein n=1 Tax=Plectus sambesii TaxID=2011161 RepID=A0A914XM16_9BILA
MQVVVWTPQPDFVQDIANKALGPRITELEDDGEELEDQDAPQQPQIVTFPDVEDADSADISVRRRRKSPNRPDLQRCSSSFLIREMIDEDGDSGKEMECDD